MRKFLLIICVPFYLIGQTWTLDFEDGTLPSPWTDTGTNNYQYTPALRGNYSAQLANDATRNIVLIYGAVDSIWVFAKMKINYTTSNSSISINNAGAGEANFFANYTTNNKFRFLSVTGNPFGSMALSNGIELGILIRYVKGTGADGILQLWAAPWNANGSWTKPGSADISVSNHDGTDTIDRAIFQQVSTSGGQNVWDDIVVSTTELGDYTPPSADRGFPGFPKTRGF